MFRDSEFDSIEVSTSHIKLRMVCFILAVIVALGAFGFGISKLIHKDEGYYEIEALDNDDAPQYKNGVNFLYYLEGSSNEIGSEMNRVKDVYGTALLRAYKLIDSAVEYDGYVNIATLNGSMGKYVQVGSELYNILCDAYAKTQECSGYNMFAGVLYAEWNSILSLDEPDEFDPVNNSSMAQRLNRLADETAKLEYFKLEFEEADYSVKFTVDQKYLDFLSENGYETAVLDLNLLSEAYRIEIVRNALESQNCCNGYICTDGGLTLSLSEHEGGQYCVYGLNDGVVVQKASVQSKPNSVCSVFRSFALSEDEIMYYTLEKDGKMFYRYPYFNAEGDFTEIIESSCTVLINDTAANACYKNIILYNEASRESVCSMADSMAGTITCIFRDGSVYCNAG